MLPTIWVNLEVDPSVVKLSAETPALANNLIAALWEILKQRGLQLTFAQIPDPHKLWGNNHVLI